MKSPEKWGAFVLSAAVLLSAPGYADAAGSTAGNPLPQPSWTSASVYDTSSASAHDIRYVKSRSLIYVHTVQSVKKTSSKTPYDWHLETVTAFDASTGAQKWSRTFHEKGGAYTIASSILYAENGAVYFTGTFSDKTQKIYALSPNGRETWTRSVSYGSDVYMLGDESLLIASPQGPDKRGFVKTSAVRCDSAGRVIAAKTLKGSILTAEGQRLVVDTSRLVKIGGAWDRSPSPSVEVYTPELKRVYAYKFPSSVNLLGDGGGPAILVQDDNTVIFRGSVAGTVNKLFAFSPQGRLLWGRVIPADSVIYSTGSGYVTYSKRRLSAFDLSGKLAEHTLEDEPGQIVVMERSDDGRLQIDMADTLYVLDPHKLDVIQAVSNLPLRSDYAFAYAGGVLYAAESGSLVKYALN
ncbi:outer membrane protein assembly factor BamB family protein [Saccharibacillus alkalitolerans]|uniref:PQQ-binding-like beta-propeller repeat protein n=1 Tax=Saccharibacillus alkalitolerans TaxID=2705290 RepID=A0ABX0F9F7_9BACL|nr:PQQ-binding-like beta-propeller repeat protein [Saccharibacillus alkalitolerans]NGZ77566.1 PQQ-binding-like beta-propeller repeat protein [Saccharibacillus alkalitolerans]